MSSVLIKGMKMPKGCLECPFKDIGMSTMTQCLLVAGWVEYANDGYGIPDACPLVELPEKHGRLVDADALHTLFENQWHYLQCLNWDENPTAEVKQTGINWCINTLHDDAPTIIEAEGDEE